MRPPIKTVSVEYLRKRLRMDENGNLFWLPSSEHPRSWNTKHAGKQLAQIDSHGYPFFTLQLQGLVRCIRSHRAVFALTHGRWPEGVIDHINRDRTDNRPSNLREVSQAENNRNIAARPLPMYVYRRRGKFNAQRRDASGVIRFLGVFATAEEASACAEAFDPAGQKKG